FSGPDRRPYRALRRQSRASSCRACTCNDAAVISAASSQPCSDHAGSPVFPICRNRKCPRRVARFLRETHQRGISCSLDVGSLIFLQCNTLGTRSCAIERATLGRCKTSVLRCVASRSQLVVIDSVSIDLRHRDLRLVRGLRPVNGVSNYHRFFVGQLWRASFAYRRCPVRTLFFGWSQRSVVSGICFDAIEESADRIDRSAVRLPGDACYLCQATMEPPWDRSFILKQPISTLLYKK